MAGYIFSLNNMESLNKSILHGIYSTIMNIPTNNIWKQNHEGTFGDYITMTEGDNVYFFHERKIYGIGELININGDCKFLNFPNADSPIIYQFKNLKKSMLLDDSKEDLNKRMLCTFKGAPHFFQNGVDMDEILASNPDKFRMLRAFWKLSFIKIDDEENKALIDIILKNNEQNLLHQRNIFKEKDKAHQRVQQMVTQDYKVESNKILSLCNGVDGALKHEMAIEVGILDYISNRKGNAFGYWDYLSHQVVASPFKPIDYMDKMDIFGYKYIPNFQTKSQYLVIEVKKDIANADDINQVMKYVDWVNQEYSFGDYNMIQAYLVAYDFTAESIKHKETIAKRNFIKGRRPVTSMEWDNLILYKYRFDVTTNELIFQNV